MSVIKRSDLITDEAFNWPKEYAQDLEKLITKSKQLGQGTTKKNMTELHKVQNQLAVATDRSTKEYVQQKAALNTLNTTTRNAVKDVQNLDNAYDKLSKELNDTRKAYKNLAASGKANSKEAKEQLKQITKLDKKLKSIDNSVGQNQRSVGGYSKAIRGVSTQFIAWTAAIVGFLRVFGDAFRRIRAFDKSIVELTGILKKTRKELKGIEDEIIKVASASTKTSSEVADLAVALATLGKTETEITRLLKPTNDLSIALKATSEDAGQLLVGTLNAFGESATEAQRYGDVIAKLRTSSALDFEGIKDALGFLAPTANAVGLSIERTSAIIGVLRDNNIKAARAGRLMSSSFARLITNGISLDEALEQINNSTDKVKTASNLFGKEAFALGLILADNVGKVNDLDESLQNAGGALDELTRKQMESFDAKLKILDSAFERFIFTITKGDNFIANDLKGSITKLTGWFEKLADAISGTDRQFENWKDKIRESNPSVERISLSMDLLNDKIQEQQRLLNFEAKSYSARKAREEKIADLRKQMVFLNELLNESIKKVIDGVDDETKSIDENTGAVEENVKALIELDRLTAKLPDKLTALQKGMLQLTDHLFGKGTIDKDAEEFLAKVKKTIKAAGAIENEELKDRQDRADQRDQDGQSKKEAIIAKSFETTSEIANRFTNLRIEQIQQELTAIEFQRDRELQLAGDNERQKWEINRQFDGKRKELQRKQVIAEKANALFQIALNTAIGISSALKTPFLIPFIAGLGAIQAAVVLATPIPQFDKGKESTPKDYIAGEKRPELRKSKGKWSLVDKPTLFQDSAGDKIVSGKETDSILGSMGDLTGKNLLTDKGGILSLLNNNIRIDRKKESNLGYILEKNNADLIRTINNKKEVGINISTPADVYEYHRGHRINRIDKYYKR